MNMAALRPKTRKILRFTGALLFFVLLVWFLYKVRGVFNPFIFGFVLAYLLAPLVDYLETRNLSRVVAIVFVYIFLGLAATTLIVFALPALFQDVNRVKEAMPEYTQLIQQLIGNFQQEYSKVPIPGGVRQISDELLQEAERMSLGLIQSMARGILWFLSQALNIILAPVVSFYFLLEFKRMGEIILGLLPVRFRPEVAETGKEINHVIKRFIRGNLLVAALVGLMAVAGMYLVGMDFPLLIGIMVGITNFIPYFGAIISAIPAILLALLKSKWLALYVLGLMLLIQQIEGNIISPKILGESVGLHPLVIIFALLVGGELYGLLGLIVAVPVAAIVRILWKHLYRHLV
jgi:predicted PurR-regulated permease PerM